MEPITRQEIFLASAAGESTQDLKPITRLEHFLKNVADHVKSIGNGGGTGGGGTSIDVTAKVGQTIVVKEVDANGKPTAWESADYQPRTHWSEPVEVLPETTVEIDPEAGLGLIPYEFTVEGGKKYTVAYNGVEYADCECIELDGKFVIGNIGTTFEGFPVTGHPFVIVYGEIAWDENENPIFGWACGPIDGSTSVTLSIIDENATQIPKKYLNNAIPYYINIMGRGTTDDPFWCNSDAETFKRAFDSGRVIMLRVVVSEDLNGTGGTRTQYYLQYMSNTYLVETGKEAHRFYNPFLNGKIVFLEPQEDGTLAVKVE